MGWRLSDDEEGTTVWRRQFQPSGSSALHRIIPTFDGDFVIAGHSTAGPFGSYDLYAVRFDIDGEIEWENYYGTRFQDFVGSVCETHDGGYCLAGTQRYGFSDSTNAMIVRIDAQGEEIWRRIYEELPRGIFLDAVVETPDHGFAVAGNDRDYNFYLQRVDSLGNILWLRNFIQRGTNYCRNIFLMEDGSYVLGGPSSNGAWLIRTTPDSLNVNEVVTLLDPAFPSGFGMVSPYPNPFNSTTRLGFAVPREGRVQLRVYDLNGREVATLLDGVRSVGEYRIFWNADNLAAGSYFVRMEAGDFSATRKVLLVK